MRWTGHIGRGENAQDMETNGVPNESYQFPLVGTAVSDPDYLRQFAAWMLLPLSLAIAVVYKTIKLENLRTLPVAALLLWLTIIGGMVAVAVGLYVLIWLFL